MARRSSLRAFEVGVPASARPGRPRGRFTQAQRVTRLRQLFYQQPKGVTLNEIAAHLGVTRRSARRYVDEMRADLEAVPERPGGEKRWRIPPVDVPRRVAIRRTQAYALLAALPLFEPLRGSALYEEIDLAAQTLLGIARRPGRGPNSLGSATRDAARGAELDTALEQRFRYLPFAPADYGEHAEALDDVFQAVAELHPLSCRYPDDGGDYRRRLLHPYALLLYKEAVCFLARDAHGGAEVGTFQLELVRDSSCHTSERFELPATFRVDDYLQGQFGVGARARRLCAVVDFDARASEHLRRRRFHPSQRVSPREGGGVRLELELGCLDELATWLLGFGSMACVVEPPELRERVRAELAQALARYQ